ncbi:MAG: hypothetical protein RIS70_2253, partial [Planctomycetota bacterium]
QTFGLAQELPELIVGVLGQRSICSSPLSRLWLLSEFPLTLALVCPSLVSDTMIQQALSELHASLDETVDASGWKSPEAWADSVALMASWTRCGFLCRAGRTRWFTGPQLDHWNAALRQLLRGDSLACGHASDSVANAERLTSFDAITAAAVEFAGDAETRKLAKRRTERSAAAVAKAGKKRKNSKASLEIAEQNEQAQVAFLRDRWGNAANRLQVYYHAQQCELHLLSASASLLSGRCDQRAFLNGTPATIESGWEHVCWHTDEEGDYLELELRMRGCRVQRQIVLARNDGFALIADAITSDQPVEWNYQLSLPLAPGYRIHPAGETREVTIHQDRDRARVIPLAAPEWRCDSRPGEVTFEDDRLVVHAQGAGRALYVPVFIDLSAARIRQPLTWRRLTVAESLTPVSADEAVAYRVQIGDRHWLAYRELGVRGNRTFFGKNICSDFFLGRFLPKKRDYETIVEIE